MSAQAEQMKGVVSELVAMVGGSGRRNNQRIDSLAKSDVHSTHYALAEPIKKSRGKEMMVHEAKEVNPEQVIPMADEDFKDF